MDAYEEVGGKNPTDPFTAFWLDWMSRMSSAGTRAPSGAWPPSSSGQDEMFKQMRQAFFDAWAQYCDEFMRSDAYLQAMKKAMDGALAFKQQVNDFLTKALHESQVPARSDTDSILLVLRSLEERMLARMDEITRRVDSLSREVAMVRSAANASRGGSAAGGAETGGSGRR